MLKVPWSCLYNCTLRFRSNNWLHCVHETLSSSGLLKVFYIIFWSVKISREENLLGDGTVMATKLSLSQHVKLATFLRTGIRAKFRNRQIFSINFLNVTLGLSKTKVNITIYLSFPMFAPEQHWLENKRLRTKEMLQARVFPLPLQAAKEVVS